MIRVWKDRVDAIEEARLKAERARVRIRETTFPLRVMNTPHTTEDLLKPKPFDPYKPQILSRQMRRANERTRVKFYKHQEEVMRDFTGYSGIDRSYAVYDEAIQSSPLTVQTIERAVEAMAKLPSGRTHLFVSQTALRALKGQP